MIARVVLVRLDSLRFRGYNDEKSGSECPFFLGYHEDSHFAAPHYQSILPTRDSSVLKLIRENDGYDVAMELNMPKISALSGQWLPLCRFGFLSILS